MADPLAIAQVTPFAWEVPHEVNEGVASVSAELAARGHRVLIIAPSESRALVRDTRRAIRDRPESFLERAAAEPVVLGVGEVLPFSPTRRRMASLPVDVARTIEELLNTLPLDLVHLHEPFAPSASSVALRHSRALNVASFHLPTERLLSTQLARPLSRLLFSRLDARIASYQATANLLQSYFPGNYEVIRPGADVVLRGPVGASEGPVELVACAREERASLRTFLRALRALPADAPWHATVWSPGPLTPPGTLSARLRERIDVVESDTVSEREALRAADILVLASEGLRPAPDTLGQALGCGVVPAGLPTADLRGAPRGGPVRTRVRARRRRDAGRAPDSADYRPAGTRAPDPAG